MRIRIPLRLALLPVVFFLLAAAPAAVAQTVRWEPSSGTLARGQESSLNLVFENCEPDGEISLPSVPGLTFGQAGISQQRSFNLSFGGSSGTRSSTISFTWPVRATAADEVRIPSFTVKTNRGNIAVASATFAITEATVGRSGLPLGEVADARFDLPQKTLWAGEVFPLTLTLTVAITDNRFEPQIRPTPPDWDETPLIVEDWTTPQASRETDANGRTSIVVNWNRRAMATRTGAITLNTASKEVGFPTGQDFFGRLLGNTNIISTKPASLTVKPLPQPAPAGFTGAVGAFTLTSKVVPEKCAVGEPVTWTLELTGTGNWPSVTALPPREVSRDFRVVQPRAQKTPKENTLFEATLSEDVILIPTRPGSYTLGPVELSVFDPQTGAYKTLRTDPVTIDITGSAPPGGAGVPPASGTTAQTPSPDSKAPATPDSRPRTLNAPPVPPAAIPRDPLPPASSAFTPVSGRTLTIWLLVVALWPLLLWAAFAWRRARATDPLRPRREARQRLAETLNALRQAAAPFHAPHSALLLAWQHDAALLWNIPSAAPHARHFPDAEWAALWQETDRVLYRREARLSPEWLDTAERALATTRLPRFSFWRVFRPGNLVPFLVLTVAAVTLVSATPSSAAGVPPAPVASPTGTAGILAGLALKAPGGNDSRQDAGAPGVAEAAYAAADFKAAEAAWRERLAAVPADWSARHNLSLALAQQDRWPESAAQAVAAFVQHPCSEPVRWQLHLALGKAGYTPAELVPFTSDSPLASLAELLPPPLWQYKLAAGVLLVALALALALAHGYRHLRRWSAIVATIAFIGGVLAIAAAALSLHVYGKPGDTDAAIVWRATTLYSVPTEGDETQKTTPVAAGTIVVMEKDYLGWLRVRFPNGQTGWLRTENLTPLWRAP
ncbi:hypothetical protein OpiT1DRAFT_01960 [Opitutaceae bacterium TAV1]|nr:hypothetical protein OpiT1DRAFT_01960 [Opitutaceae bacterium TAV1]